MYGQLETIGEQRAQHLQHLVLGRRALDTAFDVETIGVDPVGTADEFLHGPVGKADGAFERDIEAEISTRLCLAAAACSPDVFGLTEVTSNVRGR
jgi:hypothetical protein